MTAEQREQLGAAWVQAGLGEHASVAAFARFVLHLLSLGAPPEILHDAIMAMDDEVRHARVCFGVARRFTGKALGPGPMDLSRVFQQSEDPSSILEAAILEGCIDETISARGAHLASDLTEDATIRAALKTLADDESRHADLSWRFVEWMLNAFPALVQEAEHCCAEAFAEQAESDGPANDEDLRWMEKYGQLADSTKRQVRAETLRDEIRQRANELLGHVSVAAGSARS